MARAPVARQFTTCPGPTAPPKRGRGRVVVGSHPHHQHCCTGCHTTLLPRAGHASCLAMSRPMRARCQQTPTAIARHHGSAEESLSIRGRIVAELATGMLQSLSLTNVPPELTGLLVEMWARGQRPRMPMNPLIKSHPDPRDVAESWRERPSSAASSRPPTSSAPRSNDASGCR